MPGQYKKLVGYAAKYPYLVGISTKSGNLGTGILISARFVLTCGHVLHGSTSAEVVSKKGSTSARTVKVDESLDLALLELGQAISATNAKFTDSPLQPGRGLLAVGVQSTPGQQYQLSVAEIELEYRNKNDADGKILDIQLEGGARPGYSGGPIVVQEGGALLCVGVIRCGGPWSYSSNAIGLGAIRAFVAEYIPSASLQEGKVVTKAEGNRQLRRSSDTLIRPLIFTAIFCGAIVLCAITVWHYLASHSPNITDGTVIAATQKPEKPALGQPAPGDNSLPSLPQDPGARVNPRTTESSQQKDATPTTPSGIENVDEGDPHVKVWVNTSSNVYYCPGTRWYGKTKHGKYMTQAEARKKANRPAYGKACK